MKQTDIDERKPSRILSEFGRLSAKLEANPVLTMLVIAVLFLGALLVGQSRENAQQAQINTQQVRIDSLQMWVSADLASKSTLRAYAPAPTQCDPSYINRYNDIPFYDAPQTARCEIQHLRLGARAYVDRASVTFDDQAQYWVSRSAEVTSMSRPGSIEVVRMPTGYYVRIGLAYEEAALRFRMTGDSSGQIRLIDTP